MRALLAIALCRLALLDARALGITELPAPPTTAPGTVLASRTRLTAARREHVGARRGCKSYNCCFVTGSTPRKTRICGGSKREREQEKRHAAGRSAGETASSGQELSPYSCFGCLRWRASQCAMRLSMTALEFLHCLRVAHVAHGRMPRAELRRLPVVAYRMRRVHEVGGFHVSAFVTMDHQRGAERRQFNVVRRHSSCSAVCSCPVSAPVFFIGRWARSLVPLKELCKDARCRIRWRIIPSELEREALERTRTCGADSTPALIVPSDRPSVRCAFARLHQRRWLLLGRHASFLFSDSPDVIPRQLKWLIPQRRE